MSNEDQKPVDPENRENSESAIDEALSVEPPADTKKSGKKSLPPAFKYTMMVGAAGIVVLTAWQTLFVQQVPSQQQQGKLGVRVNEPGNFEAGKASAEGSNPEAIALGRKVESAKTEAALKDPNKSYVTSDPFGDTGENAGTLHTSDPAASQPNAPQFNNPPPVYTPAPTVAKDPKDDPVLNYAQLVHASTVSTPKLAIAAGAKTGTGNGVAAVGENVASAGGTSGAVNNSSVPTQDADIPAGRIEYATLTGQLNSIVPQTPPRAIIRGGQFNGAILLGQMENVEDRYLVLRFTVMTLGKRSYPISAIAVNPEMNDAGLVDTVKDRTWTRTALQAGVGFIQTFGAAKVQEGTNSTVTNGPTGSTTTTSTGTRTNKQTAIIAAGGAAEAIKPTIDQEINKMKSEVIIQPNKEMGIMFLQPVYLR